MGKYLYLLAAAGLMWGCTGSIIEDNDDDDEGDGGTYPSYEYYSVKVLEYSPAPGQFINEFYTPTDAADAAQWAQKAIGSRDHVSLGAFGGYIVVRLPEPAANTEGYDFGIAGNPIPSQNEPGVVWVMQDTNGNGLADDIWYELRGSESGRRNYSVTYYRTETPGEVNWKDIDGKTGVVGYVPEFHDQNYYPLWCDDNGSITLSGTLLEARPIYDDGDLGNDAYGWGYADNLGSDAATNDYGTYLFNRFDISHAMDSSGNPVTLTSIDFIKVQSAVLHDLEHLGEVSTELRAFVKLNE